MINIAVLQWSLGTKFEIFYQKMPAIHQTQYSVLNLYLYNNKNCIAPEENFVTSMASLRYTFSYYIFCNILVKEQMPHP